MFIFADKAEANDYLQPTEFLPNNLMNNYDLRNCEFFSGNNKIDLLSC